MADIYGGNGELVPAFESVSVSVNEAIAVQFKRDAKKVLTVYNNLFAKKLTDFGAMSIETKLGCIKYLFELAMEDANFSREGFVISKNIKGSIGSFEVKMPGLGNYFIKIGATTTKRILDQYYSDIANAAGWGGIGIVEGTALYLEQIKQEAAGQSLLNAFNMSESFINEGNQPHKEIEKAIKGMKGVSMDIKGDTIIVSNKAGDEFTYSMNDADDVADFIATIEESVVNESAPKCTNKKGHLWKEIDKDGTVECEYCGLRNSLSESVVTEAAQLVDEETGKAVKLPYKTKDFRGDAITVKNFTEPHKSSSSGRIQTDRGEFFPGVAGVKIVGHKFESIVTEAEIKTEDDFKEYAYGILKKAFADDFDQAKADDVVNGILSKADGDFGKAAGILQSSLA